SRLTPECDARRRAACKTGAERRGSLMPSPGGEPRTGADRASRMALFSASKFLPPRLPDAYVARPRLDSVLDRSADAHAIVVCGPAGAGKSALLSAFVSRRAEKCSWITLDERDNEPANFWTDVSYAFDKLFTGARDTSRPERDDPAEHFLRNARELGA